MSRPDDDQKNNASNPMPFVQQGDDDRTVIVSPANPDATVFTQGAPPPRHYPAYFSNDEIPRPKPSRKTRPVIGFSHYGKGKEAQRAVLPNLPIARELPGSKTKVVTIPPKAAAAARQSGQQSGPGAGAPVSGQSRIQAILSGGVLGGPAQPVSQEEATRPANFLRQSVKHKLMSQTQAAEPEEQDDKRKPKRMCREDVLNILTKSGNLVHQPATSAGASDAQQASSSSVPKGGVHGGTPVAQPTAQPIAQPPTQDARPPASLRRLLGGRSDAKKDEPKTSSDYRAVISASGSYLSMKVEGGLLTGSSFEKCQQRLVDLENGAPMRSRYRRSYSGNQEDTTGMEAAKENDSTQNPDESKK